MFKKLTSVFLAAIAIILCFSACKNDKDESRPFAAPVSEMPEHFDPQIAKTASERMIAVNMFDGLFKPDENGALLPCAAESYEISDDSLTYTISLRDNLEYFFSDSVKAFIEEQNGSVPSKITAQDFVFGITRGVLPETDAPFYELLSPIKNADKVHLGLLPASELGIKASDERTIVITLERKTPDFLYALSQPVSFPCSRDFFLLTKGRYGLDTEYTITNGAFYLSSLTDKTSVRINRNPSYTGEFKAEPASVTFYLNRDSLDAAKKVSKGTYDFGFFNEDAGNELGRKVQKNEFPGTCVSLVFNMNKDAVGNASLRTGLISCIETENEISLVPPYYKILGEPLDSSSAERLSYNVEKARSDVKRAFEEMKKENLTVEILCSEKYAPLAKKVVSSWQKNIGVELNGIVSAVPEDEFIKRVKEGKYDAVITPVSVDSDNAVDFLSVFAEESFAGYSSDEYKRLVSELKASPDSRKAVYCQSYLLKNAVLLPLAYENSSFAVAKDVGGIYFYGDSANVYFYKGQKK